MSKADELFDFGGASPMELIAKGRGKKVLSFIVSSLDENRSEL